MSKPRWVIDEVEVVHHAYCEDIVGMATPYKSAQKDSEDMIAHLSRPDIKDHHEAASSLVPCDHCVLGLELVDGEYK